jgi:phosphate transport system permease protein
MSAPQTTAILSQPAGRGRSFAARLRDGDQVAHGITMIAAASVILLTVLLVVELVGNSADSRSKFGWSFLVTRGWDPVAGQFGALPFIWGTVITSALALIIGIPLGLGAAIFLAELAPRRLSDALTFLIELLPAVPSVIIGVLGIFIMVPALMSLEKPLRATLGWTGLFTGPFYGNSVLAAGVALAVMIIPFIISISREVILSVPADQREAALALGATRWETTWDVVVPYARKGIAGSVFLALARSLGETMAVTMVIGNVGQISASLFAPGYSISAVIANEFVEATGKLYPSALIELGLVLFAVTIVINGLARILVASTAGKASA